MWEMGITTPSTDTNFSSRHSNLRNAQGKLVTKTLMAGTACKSCRRMKLAASCTHSIKPPWKTAAGIDEVKAILAHDPATFNREMQGVVAGDDIRIYAEFIYGFRKQDPYQIIYPVHVIWIFVDPAGGGDKSDFTIVSMAHENGREVVRSLLEMEIVAAQDKEERVDVCRLAFRPSRVAVDLVARELELLVTDLSFLSEAVEGQQRQKQQELHFDSLLVLFLESRFELVGHALFFRLGCSL